MLFVFRAMVAAKAVALRMLGAGLMVAMLTVRFDILAALPVSVAIIIGAHGSAGAMKK